MTRKGHGELSGEMRTICILIDRDWVTQVYEFVNVQQIHTSGMCVSLDGNFTSKEKKCKY